MLTKTQGWKKTEDKDGDDKNESDDDDVVGTVDASMKFANKGKSKSILKGSTTTWSCSGAIALAISGVSASGIISLL